MHRQPFSNAKYRENAQLPETYPVIKNASKDFNGVRKRKERTGSQDLRVQVLQDQAKRPMRTPDPLTDAGSNASEPGPVREAHASQPGRSPFQELPSGATSFNGLAELVANDRSVPQTGRQSTLSRLVSFDDLSAQVDSSSRQSGITRFAAPSRLKEDAPEQQGALTTFEDIATRQELQQEEPTGLHSTIDAVTRLRSVAIPDDIRSRDSFSRKPSKAQLLETLPERQTLTGLNRPCIDLSLKTRALFFSQQPFDVCREAISLPAPEAASAASGFAGARDVLDSLAQRMQRALMTWQHPSAGMPAAAVAAVASSKQGVEFLEQRRGHWREAFRSLYMAVHSSACHAFYYMSPQDAKKPFVAYFGAAGTLARPRMHAWISRSTHGLRERLRAEPHGLVFTTPLAGGADVTFRDERMQAELKEVSQLRPPGTVGRFDDKAASLLFFDGRPQAHGLFEYLLHESMSSAEAVDVPMLLAPSPFIGATLHQLSPHMLPHMGSRRDGERKRGGHKFELKGLLPPWVLDRLCHVLEEAQAGQLQVLLETHSTTTAFNLSHAEEASVSVEAGSISIERSAEQREEWQRWRSVRPDMAGSVVRELCCKDGLYRAEMEPMQP